MGEPAKKIEPKTEAPKPTQMGQLHPTSVYCSGSLEPLNQLTISAGSRDVKRMEFVGPGVLVHYERAGKAGAMLVPFGNIKNVVVEVA